MQSFTITISFKDGTTREFINCTGYSFGIVASVNGMAVANPDVFVVYQPEESGVSQDLKKKTVKNYSSYFPMGNILNVDIVTTTTEKISKEKRKKLAN